MSLVATLICNPADPALDSTVVDGARAILPNPGPAQWLFDEVAVDIPFTGQIPFEGLDIRAIETRLRQARGDLPIDIVVQPQALRRKKLLLADMDSTMIGQECIDELADFAGLKAHVAGITERASRKPTENLDAYDYYLQGMAKVYQATRHANDDALRLFYKAIDLDPNFASAYGVAAWCYAWRMMNGWMVDRATEITETARLARQAVELGQKDAVALSMGGFALAFVMGEVEDGAAFIDQALILNPNLASGWLLSGWANAYLGKPEVIIERVTRAIRLSPLDPFTFLAHNIIGVGHFFAGRYDEASSWAEKGIQQQPNNAGAARITAASHALAGRLDQAHKAMARLRQIDPRLRVSDIRRMFPFRRPEDLARYEEGLRKAGLPE